MSTSSKGTHRENEVRKIQESWGYEVERTYRKSVWSKGRIISLPNDFFGCMDLISMKEDDLIFIQVTDSNHFREKIPEILGHKWPRSSKVEIWVWYGGHKRKNRNYSDGSVLVKAQLYDVWYLDFEVMEFRKRLFTVNPDGTKEVPAVETG